MDTLKDLHRFSADSPTRTNAVASGVTRLEAADFVD